VAGTDASAGDAPSTTAQGAPRVFLSYSHDSEVHRARVLQLANRLRAEGVDAWLDRYEQAPAKGWLRWMQRQIQTADFVLVICTETYRRRFDGEEESGVGKGVTWEGLLAAQLLYDEATVNRKFIPVLLDDTSESAVPLALRAYERFRLPADYDRLYRLLTSQPDIIAPPVGEKKSLSTTPLPPLVAPPTRSEGLPPPDQDPNSLALLTAELGNLRRTLEGLPGTSAPERSSTPFTREGFWKVLEDRLGRWWGLMVFGAVLLAAVVATQWPAIRHWRPVERVLQRLTQADLPHAKPGVFNLGYAHLTNDADGALETKLRIALERVPRLEGIPRIEPVLFDRSIRVDGASVSEALRRAHEEARGLLTESGFDALIWGEVVEGTPPALKLYWTSATGEALDRSTDSFRPTQDQTLPALFQTELQDVVNLVATTSAARCVAGEEGHFVADRVAPLVERMRALLRPPLPIDRKPETTAELNVVFADALGILGEQGGRNDYLHEATLGYREALNEYTRDRMPLDWAKTQNNLGVALMDLGEREAGTARLEEAVTAFREALTEYTRDRMPLEWALTQNNIGSALRTLGEREAGTARLEEAVTAFREALTECTRDRVPLDWAKTQHNLGTTLMTLGKREAGTEHLEQAVTALREALTERTRDRVPLQWAMTENNLGVALRTLGEREAGTARLEEAVTAFREALTERTRDRVPLDWAMTQHNLGAVLGTLGEREAGTEHLEQAVTALREALTERTRDRVPLQWAMTENNLGVALTALGEREAGTARLEEAVTAHRAALTEYTRERAPLDWAIAQYNLGNALRILGEREAGTAHLEEAIAAYRQALDGFEQTGEAFSVPGRRNLAVAEQLLAKRRSATVPPSQ
jgi:tetratricopeptide (TPR) repeat protein